MAGWLLKRNPRFTYADLERDQKTVWDGVATAIWQP
jgi:predicted RNA-binding protein with PUA-like domain